MAGSLAWLKLNPHVTFPLANHVPMQLATFWYQKQTRHHVWETAQSAISIRPLTKPSIVRKRVGMVFPFMAGSLAWLKLNPHVTFPLANHVPMQLATPWYQS